MSFFSLLETSAWQIVRQTKTGERNIITCLTFYLLLSIKFPLPRPIIFTFTLCRKCGAHFSCVLETLEISGGDLKVQSSRFAIETISMSLPVKNGIFFQPNGSNESKAWHEICDVHYSRFSDIVIVRRCCWGREANRMKIICKSVSKKEACNQKRNKLGIRTDLYEIVAILYASNSFRSRSSIICGHKFPRMSLGWRTLPIEFDAFLVSKEFIMRKKKKST